MPRVIGNFKYRGTVSDTTIRKTEFGLIAGEVPGPQRKQVQNNQEFSMTRRYANEFKLSIKNSTLLRRALGAALKCVQRTSLNGHMNGLTSRMALQDTTSELGYRQAGCGDISPLKGFEFSNTLSLEEALPIPFSHNLSIKEGVGKVKLSIPPFTARRKKQLFPETATHVRIISCAAIVDFCKDGYANSIQTSELLPLSKKTREIIKFEHQMTVEAGEVFMHMLGIEFYEVVRGKSKLLKGGALKIIDVAQQPAPVRHVQPTRTVNNNNTYKTNNKTFSYKELQWDLQKRFKRLPDRELVKQPFIQHVLP